MSGASAARDRGPFFQALSVGSASVSKVGPQCDASPQLSSTASRTAESVMTHRTMNSPRLPLATLAHRTLPRQRASNPGFTRAARAGQTPMERAFSCTERNSCDNRPSREVCRLGKRAPSLRSCFLSFALRKIVRERSKKCAPPPSPSIRAGCDRVSCLTG